MKTILFLLVSMIPGLLAGCDKSLSAGNPPTSPGSATMPADSPPTVTMTDEEWKKRLTPEQYQVLREKGTERAFTGKYDEFFEKGAYSCAACGEELFTSDTKFNSGCGWPSFYAAKAGDKVKLIRDLSFGMIRTEVICAKCGGHLGHVFDDAPDTPTGQRFCINSVSLKFTPAAGAATQPGAAPVKK